MIQTAVCKLDMSARNVCLRRRIMISAMAYFQVGFCQRHKAVNKDRASFCAVTSLCNEPRPTS